MKKAVLLDFDGTIINSQPAINSYFFSLLERKGAKLTHKEQEQLGGVSIEDMLIWLTHEKNIHFSSWEKMYHQTYFWLFKMKKIRPFPGAIKLLEQLKKENFKLAVVTNSPRKYTMSLIHKNHLDRYFDVIISVDDAGVPKPNPKMLAMASTYLHTRHANCIMIDDNEPGIIAAHTLGMKSIRIGETHETVADETVSKIEQAITFIKK